DPDWETLVVDCSDRELMGRIKSVLRDGLAGGTIAHELPGLMREQGLEDISVLPLTLVLTELGAADLLLGLTPAAETAYDIGAIAEADGVRWLDDLRTRDEAGRFFLALTGFLTTARSV